MLMIFLLVIKYNYERLCYLTTWLIGCIASKQKGKRKNRGVPQLQVAANPWHQEEEEIDTKHYMYAQNKQTHEKTHRPVLFGRRYKI